MDPSSHVRTERHGRVLVIQLDREAKRNAINSEMTLALDAALDELSDDPDVWVGVLCGTTTVFCAGTDLVAGAGPPTNRGGPYGVLRRQRDKPLIAAVEGPALGGGFELVLACDLVIASATATLGLPEVSRGVYAAFGGLFRASRALPLNVAKELVLLGDPMTAARAHAMGLVNVLTEPGEALPRALAVAERLCRNSPVAVQASLRAMNAAWSNQENAGWRATEMIRETVIRSSDAEEGKRAFAERRSPEWSGQ